MECFCNLCWRHKAACIEFERWPNLFPSPPLSYQSSPSLADFSPNPYNLKVSSPLLPCLPFP